MNFLERKVRGFGPRTMIGLSAILTCFAGQPLNAQSSAWVYYGSSGQLVYGATSTHDSMIDYSSAGYGGGAALIPAVPMATGGHIVTPSGADDTSQIQTEIDRVGALPLVNGFRGAVVLGVGTFNLSGSLTISNSGVVLRGAGPSTVLQMLAARHNVLQTACDGTQSTQTGVEINFPAVRLAGSGGVTLTGTQASISNTYAQAGLTTFNVYPHSLFTVGEKVVVTRPATAAWKKYVGMDVLDNVPAGCSTTSWLKDGDTPLYERVVTAQDTYTVTLDEGIPDSIDRNYLVGYIQPFTHDGWINNVGVEDLTIKAPSPYHPVENDPYNQPFQAVWMNDMQDGWVRNVTAVNTFNSFWMNSHVNQVTLTGLTIQQNEWQPSNTPQFTHFSLQGDVSRVLIQDTTIAGSGSYNTFFVETQALAEGPNVVLDSDFTGTGDVGGHQRWATGLLADNVILHGTYIAATSGDNNNNTGNHYVSFSARNAGVEGYAHGWTSAWNVVWNSTAQPVGLSPGHEFLIEAPPGATNWCVGCVGPAQLTSVQPDGNSTTTFPVPPVGTSDSMGKQVIPKSLYIAQLLERVGTFRIVNQNSGFSMTETSGVVTQEVYNGSSAQQWHVVPVAGTPGAYQLKNAATGNVLTFSTGAYGTQATTIACGSGQPACTAAQNFAVTPGFQLLGLHYSEPLVISGDSQAAGAAVVEEQQDRNKSQVWRLVTP